MFDSESILRYGGLVLLVLAVYCQTGIFFCFFIPSGALLFTAGVFIATGDLPHNVFIVCGSLIMASFLGNLTGYLFGSKVGPIIYTWKESRLYKKKYLDTAETFYKKYGKMALTAGLFFPVIRTFAPIVAGMIKLDHRRFMLFTFVGSVLWITSFVMAGFVIGAMPFLKPYLKYIIIAIIIVITTPFIIGVIRNLNKVR